MSLRSSSVCPGVRNLEPPFPYLVHIGGSEESRRISTLLLASVHSGWPSVRNLLVPLQGTPRPHWVSGRWRPAGLCLLSDLLNGPGTHRGGRGTARCRGSGTHQESATLTFPAGPATAALFSVDLNTKSIRLNPPGQSVRIVEFPLAGVLGDRLCSPSLPGQGEATGKGAKGQHFRERAAQHQRWTAGGLT